MCIRDRAEEFIRDNGAVPTFKGFPNQYGDPVPSTLCTSVNDQVVHGIPNDTPLKEGDIVSVDCGTYMNEMCIRDRKNTLFMVNSFLKRKNTMLMMKRMNVM